MIRLAVALSLFALPLFAGGAFAAGAPDPDWPCIQRRQPQLSVAQVWTGPLPDETTTAAAKSAAVQSVARIIALRRTGMAEAEAMIANFAAEHDGAAQVALFLATFDEIQQLRSRVMAGITRYAHKQEAMEIQIEEARKRYQALSSAQPPDFDAIDKAEADLDWATRIFQDRQQSLTYVCETPVILEQRAFALGRMIKAHLPD